jgi:hypothetical protein
MGHTARLHNYKNIQSSAKLTPFARMAMNLSVEQQNEIGLP